MACALCAVRRSPIRGRPFALTSPRTEPQLQFNLPKLFSQLPKSSLPQPAPSKGLVQTVATNVAARALLVEQIRQLPDGAAAILVTVTPDSDDGLTIKDFSYPVGQSQMSYHGLYNYVAEYFARRVSGTMS